MSNRLGKRKREQLAREAKAGQDFIFSGQKMRYSGMTFTEYEETWNKYRRRSFDELIAASKNEPADVPCNGCTSCCYNHPIEISVKHDAEVMQYLDVEVTDKAGVMHLKKREDGGCVHLTEKGCGVYDHRPSVCKAYDCRLSSLFGFFAEFTPERREPIWWFDVETPHDLAVTFARASLTKMIEDSGHENVNQLLFRLHHYQETVQRAHDELSQVPAADIKTMIDNIKTFVK